MVDEDRIVANLVRNFFPYEARQDFQRATADAKRLLDRWIAHGLPTRAQRGERKFDPCEACNFALEAWIEDGDPACLAHQVASSRRMVREMRERATPSTCMAVTFRRNFNVRSIASAPCVRLRLPLPLYVDSVESVRMQPDTHALGATLTRAPARLEARFSLPERLPDAIWLEAVSLVHGARSGNPLTEDASAEAYDTESPDYSLYTRPEEGPIRVTPSVVRLMDELAAPGERPAAVVKRIWEYFVTRMKIGFIHYDELDPSDPLGTLISRGWCDCHTGSALFAALARSRSIPARIVTGAVLYPVAPSQHSWLEVLLPSRGWLPIDIFGAFLAARSLDDGEWSSCFLGHADARLTTQCFPHIFVGAPGVRVSPAWYVVQTLTEQGGGLTLSSLDRNDWILRDTLHVSESGSSVATLENAT